MTDNGYPKPAPAQARILHISDLHFGMRFDPASWKGLCDIAAERLKPNLVLITGDLVDSPHLFSLNRALRAVNQLEKDLNCQVIIVPGNHDTRFIGILPIKWVNPFVLFVLSAAAWLAFFLAPRPFAPAVWGYTAAFFTALFISRLVFADFGKKFERFILRPPACYSGLGLEIYAFDSASQSLFGARGKVPKKLFVDAQGNRIKPKAAAGADGGPQGDGVAPATPYRIAILHHHPLPIPYDDASEPLMVVDNAGAFLSEVSKLGVRLVLHGHKHHRHFSRTTINAGGYDEHEVAVLSTGTPTRAGRADGPEHHFNFLLLDGHGSMKFTPYVAKLGGTFEEQRTHDVEMPGLAEKRAFEGSALHYGLRCAANVVTIEITPDGDLDYRQEFHKFRVLTDAAACDGMPRFIKVIAGTGHIDDFTADNIDVNPGVTVRMDEKEGGDLKNREGRIAFERRVGPEDDPLDFYAHYHFLNAFAMSVRQHKEMYPDKGDYTEHFEHEIQPAPPEALDIVIKFPAGFKIAGSPRLVILEDGVLSNAYVRKYGGRLKYYPNINVAVVRIDYPPTNLSFKIVWTLVDDTPPGGVPSVSLVGKVEKIVEKLLGASANPALTRRLMTLLQAVGEIVQEEFGLDDDDDIDLSLMAYDQSERALRIVAASFALDEELKNFRLLYGDGIGGRAYKMNKGRMFIKRLAVANQTPSYFYPIDGVPYSLKDKDVDEVIISLPLRLPRNDQLSYAVLNISSRDRSSRLQDIKEPRIIEETSVFRQTVDELCLDVLSGLL
jgi:hypothetical protein